VARSTTVAELKARFEPEAPKRLLFDGRVLGNEENLQEMPEDVQMNVGYVTAVEEAVNGSWFGTHHAPAQMDEELGREAGTIQVPRGPCRIGFRLKRLQHLNFDTDVVVRVNGTEVKRVSLVQTLGPVGEWVFFQVAEWSEGGTLEVAMEGADCQDQGQGSKSGLLVDRLVAEAV
ncbi:unnamed protein product, partial [Polarella glacialis]